MRVEDFEKKLNELELTKKEFSQMVGAVYNGVVNWNAKGQTPKWVDSWLDNYEKAQLFDKMIETLKPFVK